MRTYLKVPFADKDQVKALGAKWDFDTKFWYCDDPKRFARWLPLLQPTEAELDAIRNKPMSENEKAAWRAKEAKAKVFITKRTDFSLPDLPEDGIAPWN